MAAVLELGLTGVCHYPLKLTGDPGKVFWNANPESLERAVGNYRTTRPKVGRARVKRRRVI